MKNFIHLKAKLDFLANQKNTNHSLFETPDPLQIAKIHNDEFIALICALFAYGNAKNIVNFLKKLDFSLLNLQEKQIKKELKNLKYRFQNDMIFSLEKFGKTLLLHLLNAIICI